MSGFYFILWALLALFLVGKLAGFLAISWLVVFIPLIIIVVLWLIGVSLLVIATLARATSGGSR